MSDYEFSKYVKNGANYLGVATSVFEAEVKPGLSPPTVHGWLRSELDDWYWETQHGSGSYAPGDLMTEKEAALMLGCTPGTLKNSRSTGLLYGRPRPDYVKLGNKKVLYRWLTVYVWINEFPEQKLA